MSTLPTFRKGYYPPTGFQVTLPDGSSIMEGGFDELVAAVGNHLKVHTEEATAFVHTRLCAKHPAYCDGGKGTANPGLSPGDRAGVWLTRLADNKASYTKDTRPDADTVEQRRETCAGCPHFGGMKTPGCCGTPKTVEGLATAAGTALKVKAPLSGGWCGLLGWNIKLAAELLNPDKRGIDAIHEDDAIYPSLPLQCPYRAKSTP